MKHLKYILQQRQEAQQRALELALSKSESAISDLKQYVDTRFAAMEKAVDKESANISAWRSASNEWRSAMDDREDKFLPRLEYKPAHDALAEKCNNLELRVTRNEGKGAGLNAGWVYLVGIAGFILTLIAIAAWLKK